MARNLFLAFQWKDYSWSDISNQRLLRSQAAIDRTNGHRELAEARLAAADAALEAKAPHGNPAPLPTENTGQTSHLTNRANIVLN